MALRAGVAGLELDPEAASAMLEEGPAAAGAVEVAAVLIPGGRQRHDQRLQRDIVAFFGMEEDEKNEDGGDVAATSRPKAKKASVVA